MNDVIFPFKKDGAECGFLACNEELFVFKPDKHSAATIHTDRLKANLRAMLKDKTAKLLKTNDLEAVVVPRSNMWRLFL